MPISDLKRILEVLASQNVKNTNRISRSHKTNNFWFVNATNCPLNSALPIITFSADLEQLIVNVKQTGANGLMLELILFKDGISNKYSYGEMQSENRKEMITTPIIRRDLSHTQHIPSLDVLSFTELPDNKKIEVFNIGSDEEEKLKN